MAKIYDYELHSEAKSIAKLFDKRQLVEEIKRLKAYSDLHSEGLYSQFMLRKLMAYELAAKKYAKD